MHLHSLAAHQYITMDNLKAARAIGLTRCASLPGLPETYRLCVESDLNLHDYDDADAGLRHADRRVPNLLIVQMMDEVRLHRQEYEKKNGQ